MSRLEVYDAAVTDRRAWHALPSQEFVANQFGDLSRPFNRQTGRPGDGPMRTAIACGPRLAHIGHKTRKVVVIGPEIEYLLDRSVDVDRLPHLDRATITAYAQEAFRLQISRASHKQAETDRAERDADRIASRQAIGHQCAPRQPGEQTSRRRPVGLHQGEAVAGSRSSALQTGYVFGLCVNRYHILHSLDASRR